MIRIALAALFAAFVTYAQGPAGGAPTLREANADDVAGKFKEARALYQQAIDQASAPVVKSAAQRQLAMSYAFEGDCKNTAKYEDLAVAYFRDNSDAPDRFYQQGELYDEAARVCIDTGDLATAEEYYTKGRDAGLKQPDIPADRVKLWNFRYEHAMARLAARRGNKVEAEKRVALAKQAVDGMTQLKQQQQGFLPYLSGYVAFYTGDYQKALDDFLQSQQYDPFIQCMIGQTYDKLGDKNKAMEFYRKAAATQGHNPPAAYAKWFTRTKLRI
jgi:tetratricopeptide (TPR) repeat protein